MAKTETYIDLAVRIRLKHEEHDNPEDLLDDAEWSVVFPGGAAVTSATDVMESVIVGKADPQSRALVREDGGTGRDVWLSHRPSVMD